jgi:tetratricopeptide (TPR) repeat protein
VQENDGRFVVKAILTQGPAGGILWSTSISPEAGQTDTDALAGAVQAIAAQLGNSSGPLHAAGLAWLMQNALPEPPTAYLCDLQYMVWRDNRRLADADAAVACLAKVLATDPQDGTALAASAGIGAWRVHYLADPTGDLVAEIAEATTAASRAVALRPQSSFAYEQQALVLGRQGSLDASLGAVRKALQLNPANMDAVALEGIAAWLNGDYDGGAALGEQAIAAIQSPPPWYYMTRAFNTMREQRFFDALDAAQALASGDQEFGPVIALAAASRIGRNDLIDRYRPLVMGNERFQSSGILPRLAMLIRPQVLLDRIATGLAIAGVPPNALRKPFNPDGTEKN